jgi:hypothetical protein
MALIDTSELMSDPDFIDSFTVTRQQQTIDQHGRTVGSAILTTAYGSLQAASGRAMEMLPDTVRISGAIEIYTKFRLEGPSETTQADLINWQGSIYIVQNVQPWTNWGNGFVHATCTLYDLLAPAPARRPITTGA